MASIHSQFFQRSFLLLTTTVLVSALPSHAQSAAETDANTPVIHVQSRLTVLDVVVEDANGNPVLGLRRNNFVVEENDVPQQLHTFEHHAASDSQAAGPKPPELAPGSFTNYTPLPPAETLNVLLLDTLNTPIKDQMYLRMQLQKYLDHFAQQQSLAIFALNHQLLMLQGFTSDPKVLRAALARKNVIRGSDLLDDPSGSNVDQPTIADQIAARAPNQLTATGSDFAQTLSNVQQFEAETKAETNQLRAQYTLDAMNALAHYLSNFPGRKNIIWFSGSFPFSLLPDPAITNGFSAMNLDAAEFRDTVTLLGNAQTAIYPVDARGSVTPTPFDAASSGRKYATAPSAISDDINAFNAGQIEGNMTMQMMADGTGGRAFVGTNDLGDAITKATDAGANYYSLSYSPKNVYMNGEYRRIAVHLVGVPDAAQYHLSYRRSYFTSPLDSVRLSSANLGLAETYRRIAMSHGAPAPEDIIFRASAYALAGAPVHDLAQGDILSPHSSIRAPYRHIAVHFSALPNAITFTQQADGRRDASASFDVYVYAEDGALLLTNGRELKLHLTPEDYKRVMDSVVSMDLTVSVPAAHTAFLRMGVEDMPTGRVGAIEISTRGLPAPPSTLKDPESIPQP